MAFIASKSWQRRIHGAVTSNKMKSNNLEIESFNQEFCDFLEFHLCDTFRNSEKKEIRWFWCDGVDYHHFDKKYVNDNRKIRTIAWIGQGGQDIYEMTIIFGKYSLRRYAKGTNMIDCVPDSDSMDWITLNVEEKKIEIRLK